MGSKQPTPPPKRSNHTITPPPPPIPSYKGPINVSKPTTLPPPPPVATYKSPRMTVHYIVAEIPKNKTAYIYDSRTKSTTPFPEHTRSDGKRQLLLEYIESQQIEDIISIQEYVIPTNKDQIICWFNTKGEKKTVKEG